MCRSLLAAEASEPSALTERLRQTMTAKQSRQLHACTLLSNLLYLAHLHPANIVLKTPTWSKLSEVCLILAILSPDILNSLGTLVKCDASIKAMLVDIDSKNNNEYIIEELDEEHILVKETRVNELKARLNQVGITHHAASSALTVTDDEGTLEGTREFRLGIII